MDREMMLLPLFGQVLLTFYVGVVARLRREKAVKEGFNWRYFKTFEGENAEICTTGRSTFGKSF